MDVTWSTEYLVHCDSEQPQKHKSNKLLPWLVTLHPSEGLPSLQSIMSWGSSQISSSAISKHFLVPTNQSELRYLVVTGHLFVRRIAHPLQAKSKAQFPAEAWV